MMPIGYLMIEHRLIERMVKLIKVELIRIDNKKKAGLAFVDAVVDFIRIYADKYHHGKEEDILFNGLSKKKLHPEHKKAMQRLIEEHKMGRLAVGKLANAKDKYILGNLNALSSIRHQLKWLSEFYPAHIVKEDRGLFIPAMGYFTEREQNNMLGEFCEFDNSPIQEFYRNIVRGLEKKRRMVC